MCKCRNVLTDIFVYVAYFHQLSFPACRTCISSACGTYPTGCAGFMRNNIMHNKRNTTAVIPSTKMAYTFRYAFHERFLMLALSSPFYMIVVFLLITSWQEKSNLISSDRLFLFRHYYSSTIHASNFTQFRANFGSYFFQKHVIFYSKTCQK